MKQKLDKLEQRFEEIQELLINPKITADIPKYTKLSKEFSEINPIIEKYIEYKSVIKRINDAKIIIEDEDSEIKELAEEDLKDLNGIPEQNLKDLQLMLLPKDSADDGSAYLEIRAGAGGDEASIFVGDLYRMYSRLA